MPIILSPLPYEIDALEPHISTETLQFHHGKDHKAYVDHLNKAILETAYATQTLEEIVAGSHKNGDVEIFHNAAQAWNHGFYWHCLRGKPGKGASSELASAIAKAFGSTDGLVKELKTVGEKHFGSGWVWLLLEDGELNVISTHDAETPITSMGKVIPLLTIDVWEHAYYLDWQNARPKYLDAVLAKLINWEFADENFARNRPWQYPK